MSLLGCILIDHTELVIRLYKRQVIGAWVLVKQDIRDLTPFRKPYTLSPQQVAETLAHLSPPQCWHIYARGVSEEILHHITLETGYQIEDLTLSREQDLLFKGLMCEW